jgi:hypothetical protein
LHGGRPSPRFKEKLMARLQKKLARQGNYVAEIEVHRIETDEGWSPYLTIEDAEKVDNVREALRRGDIAEAARTACVYHLTPL